MLETVALAANQDQAFAGFGRKPEDGDPAWRQQQKLLAHGENPGSAAGTEQRVVTGARLAQCERPLVQGPRLYGKEEKKIFVERVNLLNRPLRTCTVGGVGLGAGG